MSISDKSKQALDYARVTQQRLMLERTLKDLNEVSNTVSFCSIGKDAADHLNSLRQVLKEKDDQLFDQAQELYFEITKNS